MASTSSRGRTDHDQPQPRGGYGFGRHAGQLGAAVWGALAADWGLDPDNGVVAFDGTRAYAVPGTQLVEIFGTGWRQIVYA